MKKFLMLCLPLVHAVAFYYFASFILEPYKSRGQAQILSKKGNKFLKIGAVEEALNAYHQTVELNPENKFAWNILGLIYSDQKKIKTRLKFMTRHFKYYLKHLSYGIIEVLFW